MENYLLIALMIVVSTAQSILTRFYSTSYPGREDLSSPVFTIVSGFTLAIITFALGLFRFEATPPSIILGIVNAFVLVLYNTSMLKASATGPYSITIVFMIAGGIIIPSAVAFCFGDTEGYWVKILAIIGVLVSVYLISKKSGESYTDKKAFFLSCIGLAIGNGVYGSILDVHQRLTTPVGMVSSPEREEILILTYFGAAFLSLCLLLARERKQTFLAMKQSRRSLAFLIAASVVITAAVNLVVYTLGMVDTAILFTFDNSCVFLLSVLFSCVVFKEKLTRTNVIGCVSLCVALVCMSLSPAIAAFVEGLF